MAKVKRYLIGSKVGPKLDEKSAQDLKSFVSNSKQAQLIKQTPVGRHVVEMAEDQMRDFASKNPHLVVEEDHDLELYPMPGLPEVVTFQGSFSLPVKVKDSTTDKPIPNVTLYAIGDGPAYQAVTDQSGTAILQSNESMFTRLIASPADTYWSKVTYDVQAEASGLEVALKPLLPMGGYDWGHRLLGFRQVNKHWTGKGVKVAIMDSGVASDLAYLKPAGGYNTLHGQDQNAWNVDEKGHGTHCAGIVAAQKSTIGVLGGAPGADVYSVKVFPGGRLSDLVEGVEWCIINKMDLISMSLGSPKRSQILESTLGDAHARGITCVAAAGNDSTRVSYPAAFPSSIAVSAIGRFNTFPEDSAHTLKVGRDVDWQGQLFAANFTNFGPEIDVCAPGVAILSTLPTGYIAWDGTSFSCPMVSALAALVLEAYPSIRTGDSQQPEYVRGILRNSAVNLGLPEFIQGAGLPSASRLLTAAAAYAPRPATAWPQTSWPQTAWPQTAWPEPAWPSSGWW